MISNKIKSHSSDDCQDHNNDGDYFDYRETDSDSYYRSQGCGFVAVADVLAYFNSANRNQISCHEYSAYLSTVSEYCDDSIIGAYPWEMSRCLKNETCLIKVSYERTSSFDNSEEFYEEIKK